MTQIAKIPPLIGSGQPLIFTMVKQHVQRCHFPAESLLSSVSLKDTGLWAGSNAQHKPLKASELQLEKSQTQEIQADTYRHILEITFPIFGVRIMHVCVCVWKLMYWATTEPRGRILEHMKNKQCPWLWHRHGHVCSGLHVLLSGGYPLEMNRLQCWQCTVCLVVWREN